MGHDGVWIFGEQQRGRVLPVTWELLTRGRALADKRGTRLTAVVFGHQLDQGDLREAVERGADRVLALEAPPLETYLPEPYAACLMHLIREEKPEILLGAASSTGRALMPYVAIKANTGLTADCTELDIETQTGLLLQTRPAIGGNIMATIKTPVHRPQMATVRPHSTPQAPRVPGRAGEIVVRKAPPELLGSRVRRTGFRPAAEENAISEAPRVVCIGRGIKKGDHVPVARRLADTLDAALGGTRDVVDRGWLEYPAQIGLSGKTVTPRLYIGLGVSGTIQHLAGMQTAETIVAVNTDPDAMIFKVADFGIVGDLFEVVPALTRNLEDR
ncbi:MAG: electron transfer flavoprotein subunit alpha/FixB family protein [Candidatus Riflebacteria bacterium]|nr:electron transfer flavoprotein subunit alpha/FixB family protein [Candidatus Riflebacteria bacterium]